LFAEELIVMPFRYTGNPLSLIGKPVVGEGRFSVLSEKYV
jgi:hypothetical protein